MNEQLKLKKATYHLKTFFASKVIGSLGMNVYAFGMSMYILSITGSSLSFAMNILCSILPRTLISPIAGVLGDRIPRKTLVIGGQAGVVLTIMALLVYTLLFDLSVYAIYAATVFNSIFGAFSGIAFSSSIANLIDEGRLQKAMSFNSMALSISGIGGPIIGGILFGFASVEIFLIVYLISQTVALLLESTMDFNLFKKVQEVVSEQKESMLTSFKAGISYIKTTPILMAILSVSFALNFFFTSLSVGGDFALLTILKLDPKMIGMTEAAGAVGVLLASAYFASTKAVKNPLLLSKNAILIMSVLVIVAAFPLIVSIGTYGSFAFYLVLMFLFGVSNVATNMPIGVLFQTMVSDEYKSRVMSIMEMAAMSLMPLATLVYGILFDVLPAEWNLIGSGICLIAVTLYSLRPSVIRLANGEKEAKEDIHDSEGRHMPDIVEI